MVPIILIGKSATAETKRTFVNRSPVSFLYFC